MHIVTVHVLIVSYVSLVPYSYVPHMITMYQIDKTNLKPMSVRTQAGEVLKSAVLALRDARGYFTEFGFVFGKEPTKLFSSNSYFIFISEQRFA